ncbi:hypothetical protein MPNT_40162 [Candidatus Methylacidithermus pantelleriae]|uniref:Uncharacterized protein n=1 Tax=Candidatus Methylacidithermus pantelleriae TaxID=2744239 RepID=A0A8J2BJZ6_9BACT|nr:hypothetical protein MPNT_40162 [Candidatus Methylacidithermus pantelleriae]
MRLSLSLPPPGRVALESFALMKHILSAAPLWSFPDEKKASESLPKPLLLGETAQRKYRILLPQPHLLLVRRRPRL